MQDTATRSNHGEDNGNGRTDDYVVVNGSSRSLDHNPYFPDAPTTHEMLLELQDGSIYQGYSFGAPKSIAGELVFQTGMVGYPESITDPSYRGQILVFTFPLVGNYGVPARDKMDAVLQDVPAYFESSKIHIAGLVIATYAGEEYSHHLASSSLGLWLQEQGVPATYGVDTRAITKKIREKGSMLGRIALRGTEAHISNGIGSPQSASLSQSGFEYVDWHDPNTQNLVAEGM